MKKMKWGLMGAGALLDRWIRGAAQVEEAEIAAIASRTRETAEKQARKYGIPGAMSFEEMLDRQDLDVIYILTPHTAHRDLAIRAMEKGFPVVVEKPAAVTAADWAAMEACARDHGVFLMEAFWTRCFPMTERMLEFLRSGGIGDIRNVQISFAFRNGDDYRGRLYDPMLAGGALLDVGVYTLHFTRMIFGRDPVSFTSLAAMDTDELHLQVDEQCAMISQYENGAMAVANAAIRTAMPDTAWVFGTEGYIRVPVFWKPEKMEIVRGGRTETVELPVPQKVRGVQDEGYQFEIRHVQDCLEKGLKESPLIPHEATASVLRLCDLARQQWGLKYPFEKN